MPEFSSHAVSDPARATAKARKIEALLQAHAPHALGGQMLEVGAGSGLISAYFASRPKGPRHVVAVDVSDQRASGATTEFCIYDGKELPFDDGMFSLVVSNHVIEHVGDRAAQAQHLGELRRVLADNGILYLAAPSRWQFIEPHFKLPGLSWMPRAWRDRYVRWSRRGSIYDCNPLGHREFEKLAMHCGFNHFNLNFEALTVLARIEDRSVPLAAAIARLPAWFARYFYRASPTMVYLLQRTKRDA